MLGLGHVKLRCPWVLRWSCPVDRWNISCRAQLETDIRGTEGRRAGEDHLGLSQLSATESCSFYHNCLLDGYKHTRKHCCVHTALIKEQMPGESRTLTQLNSWQVVEPRIKPRPLGPLMLPDKTKRNVMSELINASSSLGLNFFICEKLLDDMVSEPLLTLQFHYYMPHS